MLEENKILEAFIRKQVLKELKVNPTWMRKAVRSVLPLFGVDVYMIWNRSYNDSFTRRRKEYIENVYNTYLSIWKKEFGAEPEYLQKTRVLNYIQKNWPNVWTQSQHDEKVARQIMLNRVLDVHVKPELKKLQLQKQGTK